MITGFKSLVIPEGEVVKIEDSQGMVLWQKASPLPYDAEIEYLEATGTQWIDTGFYPTATSTTIIDGDFYSTNRDRSFFSASSRWQFGKIFLFLVPNTIYWGLSQQSSALYTQVRHSYKIVGADLYIDDVLFCGLSYSFSSNLVDTSLIIFNHGSFDRSSNGKLYGVHITDGAFEMDLIPVRVGQVGYMYDKVSGQLFGNAGTGAFGLGPDK